MLTEATGEGGTFALYQGLYPPELDYSDEDSLLESPTAKESEAVSYVNPNAQLSTISPKYRWPLFVWVSRHCM